MSKREARLQRQLDKLAKNQEKNIRLSSNIEIKEKYIRANVKPELKKEPRSIRQNGYKEYFFSWCDTISDVKDVWSWGESRQWTEDEYNQIIKLNMDSHNNNSWAEVEVKTYNGAGGIQKLSNKYQPIDSICEEARKRWLDIEILSQFDELFRFRIGTHRRIWGIRIQHHFYLVWYERHHQICPIKN